MKQTKVKLKARFGLQADGGSIDLNNPAVCLKHSNFSKLHGANTQFYHENLVNDISGDVCRSALAQKAFTFPLSMEDETTED